MGSFDTVSDEDLWRQASDGIIEAEEKLVSRYSTLVKICSRPYFLVGGDSEDLIQEGMLGLLSAVRHFTPDSSASFKTFAEHCIRNRLLSAVKTASRIKHRPLNDSVSLDSIQFDDIISSYCLRDPEELVITRELTDEITFRLSNILSKSEMQVLDHYLEGLSYSEIACKTHRSVKSVDNAVQRIRKKLSQLIIPSDYSES